MKRVYRILQKIAYRIIAVVQPEKWKEFNELKYWKTKKDEEGTLSHEHFEGYYTTHFGLDSQFYNDKRILDIGCGPRGSLEWAEGAAERVGLDPLADQYLALEAHEHDMTYVKAGSEAIPYDDHHFDVVCSFNSLDHVEDLEATIAEIKRVTRAGGLFLLLTDLNHEPTACEPQSFTWDIVSAFKPDFEIVEERHYEKQSGGLYESIREATPYDHSESKNRYGLLSCKFRRAA